MHKLMINFFNFLKETAHFLKIIVVFCVLCLLLYWAQNLAHFNWSWINFIKPTLDKLLEIGYTVSDNTVYFFGATFEYKYGIALIILLALYFTAHGFKILIESIEEFYCDKRIAVKKAIENNYNKTLKAQFSFEQKQIKNYQIFVAAYAKEKKSRLMADINLEEEVNSMNKFLMQKTGAKPIKYGEGFLYTFNDFSHIDDVLPYFFKLIKSNAPLNYIICVQILPKVIKNEFENMKKLIGLNIMNKISTLSDTVWRYKFNNTHRYKTAQLGIYQKENQTFEAHEFLEM